jgi:hypothetical protein
MKKRIALLLLAAGLTGCAQIARYEIQDLAQTHVFLVDGVIIVGQEPLVVSRKGETRATDLVTLKLGTSGAQFAAKAATVDAFVKPLPGDATAEQRKRLASGPLREPIPGGPITCTASNEKRTEATCPLPRTLKRGFYAYTVRIEQGGRTFELDPTIMLE